jgi:hypothetical protein
VHSCLQSSFPQGQSFYFFFLNSSSPASQADLLELLAPNLAAASGGVRRETLRLLCAFRQPPLPAAARGLGADADGAAVAAPGIAAEPRPATSASQPAAGTLSADASAAAVRCSLTHVRLVCVASSDHAVIVYIVARPQSSDFIECGH